MYYKLRQAFVTKWDRFVLLQISANVVTNLGSFIIANQSKCCTNWGSYYRLGPPLQQNRAAITNWGKMYYKLGQVLQIRAIITNWIITNGSNSITLKSTKQWNGIQNSIKTDIYSPKITYSKFLRSVGNYIKNDSK